MKYKIEEIINDPNTAINCRSKKQANCLCIILDSLGKEWSSTKLYIELSKYDDYLKNTCYNPYEGCYGGKSYYKEENYKIIKFKDTNYQEYIDNLNLDFNFNKKKDFNNYTNLIDTVCNVNAWLSNKNPIFEYRFQVILQSNGISHVIKFLNEIIWSSDDDVREFSEEHNNYENLEKYLRRQIKKTIKSLKI